MKLTVQQVAEEQIINYLQQVVIPDLENGMTSGYTGPESWSMDPDE